jgi:hypothetical protein
VKFRINPSEMGHAQNMLAISASGPKGAGPL